MKKKFTYIDLFSGPGGLCTGFKYEGFIPRIAVEISNNTVQTYSENHDAEIYNLDDLLKNIDNLENILLPTLKTCLIHGDINKVTNELISRILKVKFNEFEVDLVTGGAPCESFSLAGDRAENDSRDDLFSNIIRIAHYVHAKFILFENVQGILSKKLDNKTGGIFKYVIEQFETPDKITGIKYNVVSKKPEDITLVSSDFGAPQIRKRVFVIACNSLYDNTFRYPKKTHGENCKYPYVTVEQALSYLPLLKSGEGTDVSHFNNTYVNDFNLGKISESHYEYIRRMQLNLDLNLKTDDLVFNHKAVNHRKGMLIRFENILTGENMSKACTRLILDGKEKIVNEYFPKKLYAARNRRLVPDKPSFTVTSHCLDEMLHPFENRQLTPREVARLQCFPDWYNFQGPFVKFHSDPEQDMYEQIGDAIPVVLAQALAKELYAAIVDIKKKTR